jgi:hypothetical protein
LLDGRGESATFFDFQGPPDGSYPSLKLAGSTVVWAVRLFEQNNCILISALNCDRRCVENKKRGLLAFNGLSEVTYARASRTEEHHARRNNNQIKIITLINRYCNCRTQNIDAVRMCVNQPTNQPTPPPVFLNPRNP